MYIGYFGSTEPKYDISFADLVPSFGDNRYPSNHEFIPTYCWILSLNFSSYNLKLFSPIVSPFDAKVAILIQETATEFTEMDIV